MTRIELRPFLVLGLALTILVYVGCGRTKETASPTMITSPTGPITSAPEVKLPTSGKLFADWKDPIGALLISGEQEGYLEPCGCSQGQLGGIGRRFDLIHKIEAQGLPLARIDLGSLIKNPASARGGIEQTKVKFGVALKALEEMKYDALGLSAEDLKLGVAETLSVYLNLKEKPKIVAGNVVPNEAFKDVVRPSIIAKAGDVTIGVTSVLDPAIYAALLDADKDLLAVKPPAEVLPGILAELESSSKYQVLMVQGPPELAKSLAQAFPGFDMVISTSLVDDPLEKPEMLNDGKTQLIHVGKKGKTVGVVGFFAGDDPSKAMKYARVELNGTRYKNAEPMRKLIDEEMQAQFKTLGVVANYVRRGNSEAVPGAVYVGAAACKECHPNTYAKWEGTGHAKAYDVLTDPKRNREYDAECITCHTTGFIYTSGFKSAEATPYLKGNQCENCHGPASKHVVDPDNKDVLAKMHRTAELADKQDLCRKCHDGDNSPKFDFAIYYGKIAHKGMDTYTNPKTHKGQPLPPQVAAQPK